jgi:hypothetical protein
MSFKDMATEDWEVLYENWKKSGLNQRKFCEGQGIDYRDFAYRREKAAIAHRRRLSVEKPAVILPKVSTPVPAFLKLESSLSTPKSTLSHWIEIQLPQ